MNIALIFILISLTICVVMFLFLKWYVKKRTSREGMLPEFHEYRNELNRFMEDIDAITDRDLQLVEERILKLNDILYKADLRIKELEEKLEETEAAGTRETLYTSLGRGIKAALNEKPAQQSAPELSAVRPNVEQVQDPAPAPVQQSLPLDVPAPQDAPHSAPPAKPASKRQIRSQIEQLVNEGLSPAEIASRLDISRAEVDLAMNLIKRIS